jgi:hypothetical protein
VTVGATGDDALARGAMRGILVDRVADHVELNRMAGCTGDSTCR